MTEASTQYIGRFAPSPTGPLHFGSLVAAVASFLDARAVGGQWLVRIEDVDSTRCKPELAQEILATLQAFGLVWNGDILVQTQRTSRYQQALDRLATLQLTYACSCSRREIADSSLLGIDGPVYRGVCRDKKLDTAGNAIRLRVAPAEICFDDRVQGRQCQQLERDIGDFVLKRRDGLFAYQLAVVIDDGDQNITHVVRGADLLDSTARQIYLQQALALPEPRYLHIPVITNSAGQKLSKQTLAPAISANDACALLRDALRCLGQAVPDDGFITPTAMLASAASTWKVEAIPRGRAATGRHTAGMDES
ncbi:MAG: tRNA glutamyl-Q(34) synthetase GluQRS [Betaproteobacteria bacterium]